MDAIVQKEIIEEAKGDAPSIKKAGGGIARMLEIMNPYKLREVYKQLTSQNSILKKYLKRNERFKQPDLPAFVETKNAVNRF